MTHYEVLGVSAGAPPAEVRDAYRRLARTHHPDQRAVADPVLPTSMADINEAYRVLRDPTLRSRYDADLRQRRGSAATGPGARPVSATEAAAPPVLDRVPARYPWKLVGGMAAVGAAIVLAGAALYEPAAPAAPDNLLEPGSCVAVELNNDVREVNCEGPGDLIVRQLLPTGGRCPQGLSAYRDRQGRGVACVSPEPA